MFCAMDRQEFAFKVTPDSGSLVDRFTGGSVAMTREEFYDLADLLFANELEQLHPRLTMDDSTRAFLSALLPFVSTEAIVLYNRLFRCNAVVPVRDGAPRFSEQFLHYLGESSCRQQRPGEQLFDRSPFWENDFWDMWITVVHDGVERKLAIAPDCDYASLQRALTRALELNPMTESVLGLCENLSGPLLSLAFIAAEGPWYALPEQLYQVVIAGPSARSREAMALPADDLAVERPLSELIPQRFDLLELRAALVAPELGSSRSLIGAFAAEAHKFGCAALRLPESFTVLLADAIAAGEGFFNLDADVKAREFLEFAERKFAGYTANKYREWFQIRVVYGDEVAARLYGTYPDLSFKLARLYLALESISRDTLAMLALGVRMPPERLLDLCDRPGLPPAMQKLLGLPELLEPELSSAYDRATGPRMLAPLSPAAACDRSWLPVHAETAQTTAERAHQSARVSTSRTDADADFRRTSDDFPGSNVCRFFRYNRGLTEADREKFNSSYPSTPHADIGLITVAPVSPQPALEVQSPTTELMPCIEEGLDPLQDVTVMVGELLGYISRGFFRAPIHRVLPNYPEHRYSMPFFMRAHPFSVISVPQIVADTDLEAIRSAYPAESLSCAYIMDAIVQSRSLARPKFADY